MSRPRRPRRPLAPEVDLDDPSVATEGDRPSGVRRIGRFVGLAGGGAAVLGALAIGLFPTKTFIAQHADTTEAEQRLVALREQNASFKKRIDRLSSDEEIERLAREQYNLAFPGEEVYAVLPSPLPPLDLPEVWPFGPLGSPAAAADPTP